MIYSIFVGIIAGWLTGKIMKGSGYGIIGDLVLGLIGGIIGGWLLGALGFGASGGLIASILVSILGAVILVALVRTLRRV